MNICEKKCCKVGELLYNKEGFDDISDIVDNCIDELEKCEAFVEMQENCGDINYILPSYCVEIGHLDCLKYISKLPNFMYHSDLAVCAMEHGQIECVKWIIENMKDVHIPEKDDE